MRTSFIFGTLLLAMTVFSGEANAQDVVYKDKTEIDFEAVDVEGQLKKPQGQITMERIKANFSPLVQLRENFSMEMTQSVNDIQ